MSIVDEHARFYPGLFDPVLEPVLFWGQSHPQWRALSNFAGAEIVMAHPHTGARTLYPTVEHYFQACKADDAADHDWVRAATGPAQAKARGSRKGERQLNGRT